MGALAGDGLVVVGADDGVNDAGLVKVLRAFDPGHIADKHAVSYDLGFEAGCAVGVPLGFAAAGQRHADAELADAAAEQVSVDAALTKGVDHTAGPEFVHARKLVFAPEESLNVPEGWLNAQQPQRRPPWGASSGASRKAGLVETTVTVWNMPRVLLEMVPETAPLMARTAAQAYDVGRQVSRMPAPSEAELLLQLTIDERMALPYFRNINVLVGQNLQSEFGTYSVAAWLFLPIFEEALEDESLKEDLVRRCCAFLEAALAGEEAVSSGVVMMVAENFGVEQAQRVLPYAGPRFRDALRSFKWIR